MTQIQPTNFFSDYEKMRTDIFYIINKIGWNGVNQIGLNYRPGANNTWTDAVGSLFDRQTKERIGHEKDFSEFNELPDYLVQQLTLLKNNQNCNYGRIRIMRLTPRTGLSVHEDCETRYHYVIETNNKSFFCFNTHTPTKLAIKAQCFHLPKDGQWYHIDTTKTHWVYNGGDTERIHLVICSI